MGLGKRAGFAGNRGLCCGRPMLGDALLACSCTRRLGGSPPPHCAPRRSQGTSEDEMEALAIYMGHSIAMQVGAASFLACNRACACACAGHVGVRSACAHAPGVCRVAATDFSHAAAHKPLPASTPSLPQRDTYDRRTRDQKVTPAIALMERLSNGAAP